MAPNGDTRTYGKDGTPSQDYDHSDHGNPKWHPHDEKGGHKHDWVDGKRGPAHLSIKNKLTGAGIVVICSLGVAYVALNDLSGAGTMDDYLMAPLVSGIREGVIRIFK